ncbi:hypothetical protein GUJ93_ZPchr0007g3617 [Zizania palustris]|uniref:Zinc finger LSD1-type domain-containing protein n=1 Tax=Zizania palustris TaxID=103762 RepID=A0A8J5TBB8_ZIZPA|nr:hypothetical protein GUJ93_ZPchr0007g3617 [Zizania palustris]
MGSPPLSPSPPPLQVNPSLSTAAPPEPAQPDHATPIPLPSSGQATDESPEEPPPPLPPSEGASGAADSPPSSSSLEMATSAASPALEAATAEQPSSPSLLSSAEAVDFYPEAAACPAPSAQIAEALPEDTPPASPSTTTPTPILCAPLDSCCTEPAAMASPAREPMGLDAVSYTAPEPSTLPSGSIPEGFQQQQQPPPSPTAPPDGDSSEPAQLALPPLSPAEITAIAHAFPDAAEAEVVAVTPEKPTGSTPAMEATDRATHTAVSMHPALESGAEWPLQESMPRPPSPTMDTVQGSPERAPPGFENFKSSWLPLPPSTPPADSMPSFLVPAAPKAVVVMPEEVIESVPSFEPEKSFSISQAEPKSPDMPPPGFENYKSSWLPLPIIPPPFETSDVFRDVVITKVVEAPLEEVVGPLPAIEVMTVETNTVLSLLPASGSEGLLQQPLSRPPSPIAQSEPCLPEETAPPGFENLKSSSEPCLPEEMAPPGFENFNSQSEPCSLEDTAPPGFENFKSSWAPLPALSQTTYALPDADATDTLAVRVEEEAGPPAALEAMDVDMDVTHRPPLAFESGVEGSLQEPLTREPSPMMQEAACSSDVAPPGFETYKSSQLLPPSSPLAQTAYIRQDRSTTETVSVMEEAPQPLHSLEVTGANMDAVPPRLLLSESRADEPTQQFLRHPSPVEKGTCLPDMVPSGGDDLQLSQLLPPPAFISPVQMPDGLTDVPAIDSIVVTSEESPHGPLVSRGMEDGIVPILSSPLENGFEESLQQLESQAHSPTAHAADSLLDAHGSKPVTVASKEIAPSLLVSQATNTDLDSTTAMHPLSENTVEESLSQPQHQPSSTAQASPCLQDTVQLVPPPPPPLSPCLNKEIGQLVCGGCRNLLAYFRGAVHVHCTCCQTINLVLEAHEVGKVHCGRCETLLMYPFGAPAVKCSLCLFVTEIGERNVRPRTSIEQAVLPDPPALTPQG